MERSFFEKLAKSNGFPNPSDEQIEEIKKLHTKNTISDENMKTLIIELQENIRNIIDSIDEDFDKEFYSQYFHSIPMTYFYVVPRDIIKKRLVGSNISKSIFSSIPDPISIQNPIYDDLNSDMERYYQIYKETNEDNLIDFILDPVKFINENSIQNSQSLVQTLRDLKNIKI